ncbi:hypothetical protein [Geminicoccus harenae]|uniref:hypothetical protein n=1 Tax=Geminicoccus harenae TaxID=2498453 RepID=UPI001C96A178|nr:hypothetical protein [Geminicoccus harenae]
MRQQSAPVFVPEQGQAVVLPAADRSGSALYDEGWIQRLVHEHPAVLPIERIEPGFTRIVPVCQELPLRSGSLDNLLMTPDGNLVLVECKLWRNPQARREVLAQVIDYPKDLVRLDYEALEEAVRRARRDQSPLYRLADSDLDEATFVDAVARNLRLGRVLLIVAGDGITEAMQAIADYLQQHAGLHFTLALVELAIFDLRGHGRVVVPSIPLQTTNVVRGIVLLEDRPGVPVPTVHIMPPPDTAGSRRASNITEAEFFSALDARRPETSIRLLALVEKGQDIGLFIYVRKTLIVAFPTEGDRVRVLVVDQNGHADTSYVWWLQTDRSITIAYLEEMADAIPGALVRQTESPYVRFPDRPLSIWDVLDHGDAWLEAVMSYRAATQAAGQRSAA